jgi:hypothetical protein
MNKNYFNAKYFAISKLNCVQKYAKKLNEKI